MPMGPRLDVAYFPRLTSSWITWPRGACRLDWPILTFFDSLGMLLLLMAVVVSIFDRCLRGFRLPLMPFKRRGSGRFARELCICFCSLLLVGGGRAKIFRGDEFIWGYIPLSIGLLLPLKISI